MGEKNAILLLSGGLDSSTTLAIALDKGYNVHALSFEYGQKHLVEIEAAKRVAKHFGVTNHKIVKIDLATFGGSALTDNIPVPENRSEVEMESEIPVTYVFARNTIFLSFALAYAEMMSADTIYLGVNAIDYSGYPDCRPEFLEAYQNMANLAIKAAVEGKVKLKIEAPLLYLKKSEIIAKGLELGVDYSLTNSCYQPDKEGNPCQKCDACQLRMSGFESLGMTDPLVDRK